MTDRPPVTDLIVDYLGRGPATTVNVASHFGMDITTARAELERLEQAGAIRGRGNAVWETGPPSSLPRDAVWTNRILVSLFWRPDGYGNPGRALYARDLYLGHVTHWTYPDPSHRATPWRAWLMTDEEGEEVGWWATEQEAKDALVDAALKALNG